MTTHLFSIARGYCTQRHSTPHHTTPDGQASSTSLPRAHRVAATNPGCSVTPIDPRRPVTRPVVPRVMGCGGHHQSIPLSRSWNHTRTILPVGPLLHPRTPIHCHPTAMIKPHSHCQQSFLDFWPKRNATTPSQVELLLQLHQP